MDQKKYLHEVGQNLADLFYNQNNMKQTAIEWLEKRFYFTKGQLIDIDFEQAKTMEKEQIKDAYMEGYLEEIPNTSPSHYYEDMAEQYYNETFKSE